MIEALNAEIARQGDRAAVIPIHRLQDIRQDIENLKSREELNSFQQYIVDGIYSLELPDAGFEIRSIIMTASPKPSVVNLTFHWRGKRIQTVIPVSYVDKGRTPPRIETYLAAWLDSRGYHVRYAPQLPHKLMAVRSGLGRYGRNNICFVEGMGSFVNLNPFFSDMPCPQGDEWQEIRQMDVCATCRACWQACPTGAILPNRFLINNMRCLTYFNEAGGEWEFPDWINPAAHHTLYGCLRCQTNCPVNRPYLNGRREPIEFSEVETGLLMDRKPYDQFPESLQQKVDALDMTGYLSGIPRNLRALFKQAA